MKKATQNFPKLATDPAAFREALLIDANGRAKKFGESLDDWQRQDFEALDPAWLQLAGHSSKQPRYQRAYLERPRGHSKTTDIAISVTYCLFAATHKITGVVASGDKEQAGYIRNEIDRLVRFNPWLSKHIEVQRERVVNIAESTARGSELLILSSDAPTSYGLTPDFVVCDEFTHWKAGSGEDLWYSLFSAAAKRASCVLLIIANAGFEDSWQYPIYKQICDDPSWYFNRLEGPRASWMRQRDLEEQERLMPRIRYERLWLNQWSTGSGDAIDPADIKAAITVDSPPPAERGWVYVAGLDIGVKKDATGLVVVGRHIGYTETKENERPRLGGTIGTLVDLGILNAPEPEYETSHHAGTYRYKVARVRFWKPEKGRRVKLEDVEKAILELSQALRISVVGFDPHEAQYLTERLQNAGIATEEVSFTGGSLRSMCTAVLEAFGERQIDLFPHDQLLTDLKRLRVVEKSYGVRLESPRGPDGHGDCATALSIALHIARRHAYPVQSTVNRPLVIWPPVNA